MRTTNVITDEGRVVSIHHNGDYSGDCIIIVRGRPDRDFTLPCEAVLRFAATAIRSQRIASLEQADWKELLK